MSWWSVYNWNIEVKFRRRSGTIMDKCKITYCTSWNYKPKAAGLAEELKRELGVQSELIPSSGGVFEIEYGGNVVFSKKNLGRFPDEGEVLGLIKKEK
jgi:selenoprotein W-related protein